MKKTVDGDNDEGLESILARLGLSVVRTMDENESFAILRCVDTSGLPRVLKYLHHDSADARRRMNNEALLLAGRRGGEGSPRLLTHRAHGTRFLLTDYDPGELLRPGRMQDEAVCLAAADALAAFHDIRLRNLDTAIVDREPIATYYRKVLAKHLLHLVPSYLSLGDAAASARILQKCLPAISSRASICHGDFLPTNLLYHPDDQTITITDLEGFITANHPLFDIVALFTTDERPLSEWNWQPRFLERYLAASSGCLFRSVDDEDFDHAYRGILTFFLVYRLNEARLHVENKAYFDGLSKAGYLRARAMGLPRELIKHCGRRGGLGRGLETRHANLRLVLAAEGYQEHRRSLVAPLSSACVESSDNGLHPVERASREELAKP
jgi:hypothetical protein